MASQTRIAGTGTNDSSVGTAAWIDPGHVTANDNVFTGAFVNNGKSNYLKATNFGFTIPSIATIDGIVVRIGNRAYVNNPVYDSEVRIVKGGTIGGANRSEGKQWPNNNITTEVAAFGSSTDLWGESWTPADINSSNFGAVLSVQGSVNDSVCVVDFINITVHYSLPPLEENVDKVAFYSGWDIDKIVQSGEVTIINDGSTSWPQEAKIVTSTVTNSYGKAVFARARWSVDGGTSWQALGSKLYFGFNYTITIIPFTTPLFGLRAAVSVGCSSSSVHFRTANGYHGDVLDDGVNVSYTPISQTFIIQYWLFEDVPT